MSWSNTSAWGDIPGYRKLFHGKDNVMEANDRQNWQNRTLFHGDNLPFLRGMNSNSVHLISTDPPFNKNRDFHATPDSLADGASFQDHWSWERDVHQEWVDQIKDDFPHVMEVINGSRASYGDDMGRSSASWGFECSR